jgi:uncharacterized protein (TIGR03083 family)
MTATGDPARALEALRTECGEVSRIGATLGEEDFGRPTRLPLWNVKELLGHLYRGVERIRVYSADPAGSGPTHDSVTYFRSFDGSKGSSFASGVADRGREVADRFPTGRKLVEAWDGMWPGVLDEAESEDPSRVVVTFGPALTLVEYLRTRVLEVTVHRMDLEDALGVRGWGSDVAVGIVDEILVGLLGGEPPHELDWDVVDFIETGTGRRDLTARERKLLGARASRFPLLG